MEKWYISLKGAKLKLIVVLSERTRMGKECYFGILQSKIMRRVNEDFLLR